ncbi:SAM-dependent methyltransferase, BioC-like [hydrothermal vent metagenome]|uniref:SAM-dependent methyltransferase, BioC-like n=1 Tax=hydrothermal vent metagenome TaxID=652676 RepID=A0A3B0S456_9ZZZZ
MENPVVMNTPTSLFDLSRIARNRKRATQKFAAHDFLHQRVWQDLMQRRAEINRPLSNGLVRGDLLPAPEQIKTLGWQQQPFATQPGTERDLLLSFFELHLIDDLPAELRRCKTALKPDGVFLACLFGGSTLFELRQSLLAAESQINGSAAARIIPFVAIKTLGTLVQQAGFALPVIDVDVVTVQYASLRALRDDIRGMGEANPLAASMHPLSKSVWDCAETWYREHFSGPDNRLIAHFEILHICGWAPHDSQQKPLKPGSRAGFFSPPE